MTRTNNLNALRSRLHELESKIERAFEPLLFPGISGQERMNAQRLHDLLCTERDAIKRQIEELEGQQK